MEKLFLKENLDEYLKKYKGMVECTVLVEEIPHPSLVDKIDKIRRYLPFVDEQGDILK